MQRLGRTRGPDGPAPGSDAEATDPLRELERHFGAAREQYRELSYEGSLPEPQARLAATTWPWRWPSVGVVAAGLVLVLILLLPARRVDDGLATDARVAATERPLVWKPNGRMTRPGPLLARPTAPMTSRPSGFRLPRRPQPIERGRSDRG